jgi:hypothetical protein
LRLPIQFSAQQNDSKVVEVNAHAREIDDNFKKIKIKILSKKQASACWC